MEQGRRRHYRVEDPPLDVAVEIGDRVVEAELEDLSIEGARIRVPRFVAVADVGTSLRLILGGEALPSPLWIRAATTHCERGETTTTYGLRFDEPSALVRLLTPDVLRLFNRRSAQRAGPGPDDPPVPVVLEGAGRTLQAILVDLSTQGVAVRIDDGPPPAPGSRLKIVLDVPDGPAGLALAGSVKGTRDGGAILVVEVDPGRSPEPEEVHEALLAYVVRQQRAVLERRSR